MWDQCYAELISFITTLFLDLHQAFITRSTKSREGLEWCQGKEKE